MSTLLVGFTTAPNPKQQQQQQQQQQQHQQQFSKQVLKNHHQQLHKHQQRRRRYRNEMLLHQHISSTPQRSRTPLQWRSALLLVSTICVVYFILEEKQLQQQHFQHQKLHNHHDEQQHDEQQHEQWNNMISNSTIINIIHHPTKQNLPITIRNKNNDNDNKNNDNNNNNNTTSQHYYYHTHNIHREQIDDIDVIWETPPSEHEHENTDTISPYKGILFVAHGCSHSHTDFWPNKLEDFSSSTSTSTDIPQSSTYSSWNCTECLGLPEEIAIVRIAVDHYKLIVVAISSYDRRRKCWNAMNDENENENENENNNNNYEKDSYRVARVLKSIQDRYVQTNNNHDRNNPTGSSTGVVVVRLPIYAFGASSGGAFVPRLGQALRTVGTFLTGYISQIMVMGTDTHIVREELLYHNEKINQQEQHQQENNHYHHHPTTFRCAIYITMNRDIYTDQDATKMVDSLSELSHSINQTSTSNNMIDITSASTSTLFVTKHIRVPPVPIDEYFFAQRISYIPIEISKRIFHSLVQNEYLDQLTEQNYDVHLVRMYSLQYGKYYLRDDPRRSNWRDIVRPHLLLVSEDTSGTSGGSVVVVDSLQSDRSPISEIMNVAYGQHEMTRDGVKEALALCLL